MALGVSAVTLWLTYFRRGSIVMTRPTVIYFGPDGSRRDGRRGPPKVFLRALLISDSKRGRIIQSLWVTLSYGEVRQNFNVWVYGDGQLVRGSGLHVSDTGFAVNHHFLVTEGNTAFRFDEGRYKLEVFAEILGDSDPKRLISQELTVSDTEAAGLAEGNCGLFFDWGPQAGAYHKHVDRSPDTTPAALRQVFETLAEHGRNSGADASNPD